MIALLAFMMVGCFGLLVWALFALASRNATPLVAGGCVAWAAWTQTNSVVFTILAGVLAAVAAATLFDIAARSRTFRIPVILFECATAFVIVAAITAPIVHASNSMISMLSIGASGLTAALLVFRKRALDSY